LLFERLAYQSVENQISQGYKLSLLCQHPPEPYPVREGGSIRKAKDRELALSLWLNCLVTVLNVVLSAGAVLAAGNSSTPF